MPNHFSQGQDVPGRHTEPANDQRRRRGLTDTNNHTANLDRPASPWPAGPGQRPADRLNPREFAELIVEAPKRSIYEPLTSYPVPPHPHLPK